MPLPFHPGTRQWTGDVAAVFVLPPTPRQQCRTCFATETQQKHKHNINTKEQNVRKPQPEHQTHSFTTPPRQTRTIEPTSNLSVVQAQLLKHFVLDFFLPGHGQKQIDPGQTHPIQKVFPIRPGIPHQTGGFSEARNTEVKHQKRGSVRPRSSSDPSRYCVGCWCTNVPHVSKQ